MSRKKIAVLTTGGTIAGANAHNSILDKKSQVNYSGPVKGDDLINSFPELANLADIEVKEIACVDSMYINSKLWTGFAREIYNTLKRDDIDGILMSTGTYTMEYIALAQALMVRGIKKPIGITGTMVTAEEDRNHALTHLEDTLNAIVNSGINEVFVCFSGDEKSTYTNLYRGANAVKVWSDLNNAFVSWNEEPIASVRDGSIKLQKDYKAICSRKDMVLNDYATEKIGWLTYAPGLDVSHFSKVFSKLDGLVIKAGVAVAANHGLYKLSNELLDMGVAVVATDTNTKCLSYEILKKDNELKKKGMVDFGFMPASKAQVKLSWAIPQANGDFNRLKEIMYTNYTGELNNMELRK